MVLRALPYPHYGNGDDGTGMAGMGTGSQDRKERGFSFSAVLPWSGWRQGRAGQGSVFSSSDNALYVTCVVEDLQQYLKPGSRT